MIVLVEIIHHVRYPKMSAGNHRDFCDCILNSSIIGHWWYNTNETQTPLYTRYQPPDCRGQSSSALYRCKELDLSGFDRYKFRFSSHMNIADLKSILNGKEGTICLEGASHAGQLHNHTSITLSTLDASIQRNIQVSPFTKYTRFANEFNSPDSIKQTIDTKCTKVIIGTGQWDTGWPKHHPTSFSDYEKILNSSITTMLKMFHDANIDDYYRSMQSIDCSTVLLLTIHYSFRHQHIIN